MLPRSPEKWPHSSCLPAHRSERQQTGQLNFPLLPRRQSSTLRQENWFSPAQGEIWQAQATEYFRRITNQLVYLRNFLTCFLHLKVSLHCRWGGGGGGENTTKPRVPTTVRAAAWQVHDRKDNLVLTSLTSADHSILFSPARDQLCPPTFLCAFMFLLGIRWMNTMILMHLVTTFSCKQFLMKALKHFYLKKKEKKKGFSMLSIPSYQSPVDS